MTHIETPIVYIQTSSNNMRMRQLELSLISLMMYNSCKVYVLTNANTKFSDFITNNCNIVRINDFPIQYDDVAQSRWIKTRITHYIKGRFLFIDCDTIILHSLEEIDILENDFMAVIENNKQPLGEYAFEVSHKYCIPVNHKYYNSGVIFSNGSEKARSLFDEWNTEWRIYMAITNKYYDQPALFVANKRKKIVKVLYDKFNWIFSLHGGLRKQTVIAHYCSFKRFNSIDSVLLSSKPITVENINNIIKEVSYINEEHNSADLKIFLCAHKPIENYIPDNKKYVILAQNKLVIDKNHEVIYMDDYDFAKTHSVCYSEGCAMRYLYDHPEIIPEYICFGHYRRMFLEFAGDENWIMDIIDRHGAIIKTPWDHRFSGINSNRRAMVLDHPIEDGISFMKSVKEAAPEYWNTFISLLYDNYQYACNIFAMKKEHFLEMSEMCFRVLDHYDKKRGYKNNEDVYNKMVKDPFVKNHHFDVNWHSRLQGFWLEWLTELYYRQKFGIENCYITEAGIPRNTKTKESDKVIDYYYN